ncbi:hypothetical protein ABPG74_002018 [Tetrahymena malaccensis]
MKKYYQDNQESQGHKYFQRPTSADQELSAVNKSQEDKENKDKQLSLLQKKNISFLKQSQSSKIFQIRPSTSTFRNSQQHHRGVIQQESNHFKSNFSAYDKEKLFEELMQHKEKIKALTDENYKIKTVLVNKDRELKKYEKVIEELQASGNLKSLNTKFSTESFLYINLKKQIKELNDEVKFKTEEINTMKKNSKYTKYLEIEQEKKCFVDETIKMRGIIQNLQEQLQRNIIANDRLFQLENQQTINANVISTLKQSNQELEEQLKEAKNQLKNNKEQMDKQNTKMKSLKNELNKQNSTISNNQNKEKEKIK